MIKKKLVLHFPPDRIENPTMYRLIKDYGLMVNILQGTVSPGEEGRLIVELSGEREKLNDGLRYLSELGITLQPLFRDVHWYRRRCTHCTACVPLCPTKALSVNRKDMTVSFDKKLCIACELCVQACPYGAVKIIF
jgi:L-aspartate semialdehyde sulfurtransferase ferredoxin